MKRGARSCSPPIGPPKEIPGLESRLVSRFEWGMVANVDSPDLEHRIAILKKKASLDHLELTIPDEVIEFIAQHVKSSVRELEGSIIKLLAYASLKHREISVELAREALRDKLRASANTSDFPDVPPTSITVATIQQVVAREWGVTPDGLRSKTRTKQLTVPRQVAMYLCRELLALQLVEIGNAFGGRDHSTVIHSLDRVAEDSASTPGVRGAGGAPAEHVGNPADNRGALRMTPHPVHAPDPGRVGGRGRALAVPIERT